MSRTILGIFPQLDGHGGVQRLGRHMAHALTRISKERGMKFVPFSLLGKSKTTNSFEINGRRIDYQVWNGSRIQLALASCRLREETGLVWIAHPYLSSMILIPGIFKANVPAIVHAHGIEVWERLPFYRRYALARATIITASSQYTGRKLEEVQKLDKSHVRVLYPALDPGFTPARKVGVRDKAILVVSRLGKGDQNKGVELAIRAFASAVSSQPDWKLNIVGDGDDRARYSKLIGDLDLSGSVTLHGSVTDKELSDFYRTNAVFCLPSTKEGFGIVYLEAMARGMAILALKSTAVPEVVHHGRTGLLSAPDNVGELAGNMTKLMESRDTRENFGLNGLEAVGAFTLDPFCDRVRAIVGSVLGDEA